MNHQNIKLAFFEQNKAFKLCNQWNLERYEIRLCKEEEINLFIDFIKNHWKVDHIYVRSKKLLKWQYYNSKIEMYNIVIAKDKQSGEIHAVCSFIPVEHFMGDVSFEVIWGSLWKSRDDVAADGLGLSVVYYILSTFNPLFWGGVGISKKALKIDKALGMKVGSMKHYFIPNRSLTTYKLITICQNLPVPFCDTAVSLEICSQKDFFSLPEEEFVNCIFPVKKKVYFVHRFFNHPYYHYKILKVVSSTRKICYLFTRVINVNDRHVIRVVDMAGDMTAMHGAGSRFQEYLVSQGAEYMDLLNYGCQESLFENAGFYLKTGNTVIPEYFEPFVKENVNLECSYVSELNCATVFFKADADQDRPNLL